MRQWSVLFVFSAILFGLIANDLAQAQQSTDRQRPFKTLIATGFEIKSTVLAPINTGKSLLETEIIVTLQKGKEVAVCAFAYINWSNMKDESMAAASVCDVRLFD